MRKIIKKLSRIVKPGPNRRNPLARGQPRRFTNWQQAQRELLADLDWSQWRYNVPVTWAEVAA